MEMKKKSPFAEFGNFNKYIKMPKLESYAVKDYVSYDIDLIGPSKKTQQPKQKHSRESELFYGSYPKNQQESIKQEFITKGNVKYYGEEYAP